MQVDVTAEVSSDTAAGHDAAEVVTHALQHMNWEGVCPWASFPTGLVSAVWLWLAGTTGRARA